MKQVNHLALALAVAALGGCQLAQAVQQPAVGRPRDPSTDVAAPSPVSEGRSETVEVDSDLCQSDPETADRTTICTMITVEPVAGVAAIAPRAPGWCDRLPRSEVSTSRMIWATSGMQALVEGRYWWATTREIIGPLCGNPDDPAVQQQTAYLYQWWANLTGLAPEQLDGLFRYFGSFPSSSGTLYADSMKEMCEAFPAPGEEDSPRDTMLARATRASLGCDDSEGAPYWIRSGA